MKYLLGSPKDFYDFVNSISKEDKVGIVTHTDVDGVASGIFMKKILESRGLNIVFIEFLNYGADALKGLFDKDFDYLFFSDLNVDEYVDDFNKLRGKGEVMLVDHHPLNEELKDLEGVIKTEKLYCSSHALFDLGKEGNYFDTQEWGWLVCAAIIADYNFNDEETFAFIKSFYPEIEMDKIYESNPGIIGSEIDTALIYYKPDIRKVFDFVLKKDLGALSRVSEEIQKEIGNWIEKFKNEAEYYPDKNLYFYYANPKYAISRIVATRVSGEEFSGSTIILLSNSRSKKDHIRINSRNQTGQVDLRKLLMKCTEGFEDSSAGGHAKAAGGDFPRKYLKEFKKRLLENL